MKRRRKKRRKRKRMRSSRKKQGMSIEGESPLKGGPHHLRWGPSGLRHDHQLLTSRGEKPQWMLSSRTGFRGCALLIPVT